jgi:hypothetical protein
MLHVVDVAVTLARPPREDRWSRIVLDADCPGEAEIDALNWACRHPGVVMAVQSVYQGLSVNQPDPREVAALVAELRAAVARLRLRKGVNP